jgi:hypothetical protein
MSSSYTPTAEFTDSTTVLADGDAANASNLNAAAKKALDRAAYLRDATDGLLVWGGNARVAASGSPSGSFKVYCPPIEAVSLLNGTTWNAYSLATETELTSATNFASGTLANSTPYYVYAKVTASSLVLEVSTTAPDSGNVWKSGATGTHRYLFSFVTDSSGAPVPMRRTSGGRYFYKISAMGIASVIALSNGTATSFTNVDCSALVPANARVATIQSICVNASTTAHGQAQFRTDGETGGYIEQGVGVADASNDFRGVMTFPLELPSTRILEYRRSNASGYASISVYVYVLGYEE